MDSWIEIYEDTKEKLDRELQPEEIEFLKWVYEKYSNEQQDDQVNMNS